MEVLELLGGAATSVAAKGGRLTRGALALVRWPKIKKAGGVSRFLDAFFYQVSVTQT